MTPGFLLISASFTRPAVAAKPEGDFVYTALGDSTGVGVGAREGGYVAHVFAELGGARPGARLRNLCRSGATSAGVLADQVPRVDAAAAGVVTIGIGVNDLSRQIPVETFAERLEAIVAKVRARTPVPVVISNLPDVSLAPIVPAYLRGPIAARVRAYNRTIAHVAARHRLALVDVYGPSQKEIPAHPEFFSADGFHPSDAGYRFWAGILWPGVRAAALRAASRPPAASVR